jgi:AcrR family transcriptional regulator
MKTAISGPGDRRADALGDDARVDGRRERGRRTRETILAAAVELATVDGLEGLTIGRLASKLGMSKSGLFAHFGSKEELQLAALESARETFIERVVAPVRQAEPGLARLHALLDHWLTYLREEGSRSGCFFDAVRPEYDSRPPGAVRDTIAAQFSDWDQLLADRVRAAQRSGQLDPAADPQQLAFELDAFGSAANTRFQLDRDPAVFERTRRAMLDRLEAVAL